LLDILIVSQLPRID